MNKLFFALPLVISLGACGGELAPEAYKGGAEDGTAGSMHDPTPPDFLAQSTICPGSNRVYGIDVSYYQGNIDWGKVRAAGKQFAIIRVSDGTGFRDPKFETYWKEAKAAGLLVGAYQFFRPTQDVNAQADLLVNKLNSVGFGGADLPPVIDVEVRDGVSSATVASRVNAWLERVKSRTGRLPALYTSPGFWSGMGTPNPLPYMWVAHWGVTCPSVPWGGARLRFWQYSSTGSVSGISGHVDLDQYNGTLDELKGL